MRSSKRIFVIRSLTPAADLHGGSRLIELAVTLPIWKRHLTFKVIEWDIQNVGPQISAFGAKADMPFCTAHVRFRG